MSEWINVKDKLPPKDDVYLTYIKIEEDFTNMNILYFSSLYGFSRPITHCTTLPSPPEDK